MNAPKTIFVSYAHDDRPLVSRLVAALRAETGEAVEYILDEQSIQVGQSLVGNIASSIFASDGILLVLPSNSDRPWLRTELALALAKAQRDKSFKVIPVVTGDSPVPQLLADRLFVDLRSPKDFRAGVSSIARSIVSDATDGFDRDLGDAAKYAVRAQAVALSEAKREWALAKERSQRAVVWSFVAGLVAALTSILPLLLKQFERGAIGITAVVAVLTTLIGFLVGRREKAKETTTKASSSEDAA